jgi:hypothetical protein
MPAREQRIVIGESFDRNAELVPQEGTDFVCDGFA